MRESRTRMALDQSLEAQSLAKSTRSEVAAAAGGGGGGAMGHVRCTDQWCDDGFFWKGNLRGGNVIAIARAVMKWRRRWIVEECCADLGKLGWERKEEGECLKSNGAPNDQSRAPHNAWRLGQNLFSSIYRWLKIKIAVLNIFFIFFICSTKIRFLFILKKNYFNILLKFYIC